MATCELCNKAKNPLIDVPYEHMGGCFIRICLPCESKLLDESNRTKTKFQSAAGQKQEELQGGNDVGRKGVWAVPNSMKTNSPYLRNRGAQASRRRDKPLITPKSILRMQRLGIKLACVKRTNSAFVNLGRYIDCQLIKPSLYSAGG